MITLNSLIRGRVGAKMAFCTKCGKQLDLDAQFCSRCGAPAQASAQTVPEPRREAWEGSVHKCPHCGSPVGSFDVCCPACGNELRDKEVADSVAELSQRLDQIESERNENGKKRGPFVKAAEQNAVSDIDQRKINLIRSFPIPNTKEDLFEFMILALSNYDLKFTDMGDEGGSESEKALTEAWKAKLEQAFNKAEVLFRDDPALERFRAMRKEKLDEIEERRAAAKKKSVKTWILIILLNVVVFGCIGLIFACDGLSIQRENERLQGVVEEVYELVDEEKFTLARAKASEIVFSGSTTRNGEQTAEKWETVRQETLEMIDEAEGKGQG